MSDAKPRVLIVGTKKSVFVTRTVAPLRSLGFEVDVYDPHADSTGTKTGKMAQIVRMIGRFYRSATALRQYSPQSVVIVMYLSIDMFWMVPLLKSRFRRVIGMAFGSDILRRVQRRDGVLGFGLKRFDAVAATNTNVMEAIIAGFPALAEKEQVILRFGLSVFDELDALQKVNVSTQQAKQRLGFDPERHLIALGYSASPGQRQMELIEAFTKKADNLQDCDFIVPIQYGDQAIARAVHQACDNHNAKMKTTRFHAFDRFQEPKESALMRLATDVLINHSISDAFSGTVQEVVYAGNVVLAVDHLPYAAMPGYGTAIRSYASLDAVSDMLAPHNLAKWNAAAQTALPANRAALNATSSWSAVLPAWQKLILPSEQK